MAPVLYHINLSISFFFQFDLPVPIMSHSNFVSNFSVHNPVILQRYCCSVKPLYCGVHIVYSFNQRIFVKDQVHGHIVEYDRKRDEWMRFCGHFQDFNGDVLSSAYDHFTEHLWTFNSFGVLSRYEVEGEQFREARHIALVRHLGARISEAAVAIHREYIDVVCKDDRSANILLHYRYMFVNGNIYTYCIETMVWFNLFHTKYGLSLFGVNNESDNSNIIFSFDDHNKVYYQPLSYCNSSVSDLLTIKFFQY